MIIASENPIYNRFLDANEEPLRALTPITGYETQPLLPLEETVQPLHNLLYNLNNMVSSAKHNSRHSEENLTCDESASIYLYTMQWPHPHSSLYTLLNRTLRSEERNDLIPWFPYLKLFLTALYKLPSIRDTIWRGIRGDVNQQYQIDQIWWGFSSCTDKMDVMEQFVGRTGVRTLFNIEAMNGKSIKAHSHYKSENEILLMPGTYFKVRSKWSPAENLFIIHLKETDAPWQLTAPPVPSMLPVNHAVSLTTKPMECVLPSKKFGPGDGIHVKSINKWAQRSVIVAGGNEQGSGFSQLNRPCGLFVDDEHSLYIVDRYNHRIMKWKCGATTGQVVAGGNGQGNRNDQLNLPTDAIFDKNTDSLIICDAENRRVVRYSCQDSTKGETIISNVDCFGLAMDSNGFLYISDDIKNEVRRWRIGEQHSIVVAGANGKGDRPNQFNRPTFLCIDQENSLYVSDHLNHRVMKWVKDSKEGIVVAGGQTLGAALTQLSYPRGIKVDQTGAIYVADLENHRIIRWLNGAKQGTTIIGGSGQGNQLDQLNCPSGMSFDQQGNLYVVDSENNRVLKFDYINGT